MRIGIDAFLPVAQTRLGARERGPALGIVGLRLNLRRERLRGFLELARAARARGDAAGGGLVRHAGRAEERIERAGAGGERERQRRGSDRKRAALARRRAIGAVGGEQPPLDLEPRRLGLALADEAAGAVALELPSWSR